MRTTGFGTLMATRKTSPNLPLPLQFLAAWIGVWLGRVLQEQVDYLKAENLLLREKLDSVEELEGGREIEQMFFSPRPGEIARDVLDGFG